MIDRRDISKAKERKKTVDEFWVVVASKFVILERKEKILLKRNRKFCSSAQTILPIDYK